MYTLLTREEVKRLDSYGKKLKLTSHTGFCIVVTDEMDKVTHYLSFNNIVTTEGIGSLTSYPKLFATKLSLFNKYKKIRNFDRFLHDNVRIAIWTNDDDHEPGKYTDL